MSKHQPDRPADGPGLKRRSLFAGAGALAGAAAVLPLAGREAASEVPAAKAPPEAGGGYRLSEHVLRYYRTTRV